MTHTLSDETRRRLALGLVIYPPSSNRRRRSWLARLRAAIISAMYSI